MAKARITVNLSWVTDNKEWREWLEHQATLKENPRILTDEECPLSLLHSLLDLGQPEMELGVETL